MDEFPGNTQRTRSRPEKKEKKKVERIADVEVVRRKKPLGKRIRETFIGDSPRGIWEYVGSDIIAPALKDIVADAFTAALDSALFGQDRSSRNRSRRRPGGSYIAYNRYSGDRRDDPRDRDRPQMSRRSRANFDFDEIILPTRVAADEVLERMEDVLAQYEVVTVSDLYDLVGIEPSYTDEKYGWEDLRGAGVQRISNGYLLDLPRPEPIR